MSGILVLQLHFILVLSIVWFLNYTKYKNLLSFEDWPCLFLQVMTKEDKVLFINEPWYNLNNRQWMSKYHNNNKNV
jgi:hypothetical protein